MSIFMTILILYINLLNLSWIRKCLFLRNMEPLTSTNNIHFHDKIRKKYYVDTMFGSSLIWIQTVYPDPVSILRKSISGRHRPVRVADGPMTARCRFT